MNLNVFNPAVRLAIVYMQIMKSDNKGVQVERKKKHVA